MQRYDEDLHYDDDDSGKGLILWWGFTIEKDSEGLINGGIMGEYSKIFPGHYRLKLA